MFQDDITGFQLLSPSVAHLQLESQRASESTAHLHPEGKDQQSRGVCCFLFLLMNDSPKIFILNQNLTY